MSGGVSTDVLIQEEAFATAWPEIRASLAEAHWREIAQDQDKMRLEIAVPVYEAAEAQGALSLVTLRQAGELVGYFVAFVHVHPHYASTLCGFVDVYYLRPDVRLHGLGVQLFEAAEAILRRRGVQKVFAGTKVYHDMGPLFVKLGWRPTETQYTKWIGTDHGA